MQFFIYDDNPVRLLGLVALVGQKSVYLNEVSSFSYLKSCMVESGGSVSILSHKLFLKHANELVEIMDKQQACRIMCLLDKYSHEIAKKLIDLGCSAAVQWSNGEDVINGLQTLKETDYYLQPSLMAHLLKGEKAGAPLIGPFSKRELDVLQLVFEEYSAKEIAAKLCLSVRTIEWHRKKMMEKAGVNNMIGLIKYGLNNQYISFQKE